MIAMFPGLRPLFETGQVLTVESTADTSDVLLAGQVDVTVYAMATAPCYLLTGGAPTVTSTTGILLPAGIPFVFRARGGDKVSVLKQGGGSDGVLSMFVVDA